MPKGAVPEPYRDLLASTALGHLATIGPLSGKLSGHDLAIVVGAPVFRYYPYVPGPYLPSVTALLRDAAVSLLHRAGVQRVASCLRAHSQHPERAVALVLGPLPTGV